MRFVRVLAVGMLFATLNAIAAAPLAAQEARTVDLSILGRYSILDDAAAAEAAIGFGGRLGYFVRKNWALELTTAFSTTSDTPEAQQYPWHLQVTRHMPISNRFTGILGGGYVYDRTDPVAATGVKESHGISGIAGLQMRLTRIASLRVDAIYDHIPNSKFDASSEAAEHLHFQAGLVLRRAAADTDGDGVGDRRDSCAGTPSGTPVDASGCALDDDRDGVANNTDRCSSTPAGTPVDANGCSRDSDSDGVLDNADRCANTPAGTPVDANGCPRDSDGDGVLDNADRCANTPAGTRVDASGCPVPVDSDRDGVLDNADRCANTPAGTRVDATGCPVPTDADGDGVFDSADRCANTPAGTRVDERGCTVVFEAGQRNIVLEGVTFETGRAVLTASSTGILDRVAESLVAATDVNLEVQGHTDNTGSATGNNRISQQRADAVRQYLIGKGVAAERLTARGYGSTQPKVDNGTAAGRAENRRVELRRTN